MERWEAIYKLFTLDSKGDGRYRCLVCQYKLKTERGIYRHIEIGHNTQINELRNEAIGKETKTKTKIKKTSKAKKADYSERIERYLDCPHCCVSISDDEHAVNIFEDVVIECPHCGKEIKLGRCI